MAKSNICYHWSADFQTVIACVCVSVCVCEGIVHLVQLTNITEFGVLLRFLVGLQQLTRMEITTFSGIHYSTV